MLRWILWPLAVAACVGLGWWTYQDSLARMAVTKAPSRPKPPAVETVTLHRRSMDERISLVGSLQPTVDVEVRARQSGYVTKLSAELGDPVELNQPLVELDLLADA